MPVLAKKYGTTSPATTLICSYKLWWTFIHIFILQRDRGTLFWKCL